MIMRYWLANFICKTPLNKIEFISQWIDDEFDRKEHQYLEQALGVGGYDQLVYDVKHNPEKFHILTKEESLELDELLKGVKLND